MGNIIRRFWSMIALFAAIAIAVNIGLNSYTELCIGIGLWLVIYFGGLVLFRNANESIYTHRQPQDWSNVMIGTTIVPQSTKASLAEEAQIWRRRFSDMQWLEQIGDHTNTTLALHRINLAHEIIFCVAYADLRGTHITNVNFDGKDLTSPNTVFIATSKQLILVNPSASIAVSIPHEYIERVGSTSTVNRKKIYTITTKFSKTAHIEVQFASSVRNRDEETVDTFFQRVSSAAAIYELASLDVYQKVILTSDEAKNGTSKVVEIGNQSLEVKIPPGVENGTKIRVAGNGKKSPDGKLTGDLYVIATISDSPIR